MWDERKEGQEKRGAGDRSHKLCWPRHDPFFITSIWLTAPPGLALPVDLDQIPGEMTCCIVKVILKRILNQNVQFIRDDVTSWCRRFCPLLFNGMMWPYQTLENTCDPRTCMGSKNLSRTVSMNWVTRAPSISGHSHLKLETLRTLGPLLWKEPRSPSLKADVHTILLRLMLCFYGFVVLIWKTTKVCAARCGVCIEVGPSPFLPSSVHQCLMKSC